MGLQNNRLAQRFYQSAPVKMQDLAVTTLGYRIKRTRYNSEFEKLTRKHERNQWRSRDEWRQLQVSKFNDLINIARNTTTHYQELPALSLDQDRPVTEQLEEIPLLEPEVLKSNPQTLISSKADIDSLISLSTSGTTGTPKTTYHTPSSQRKYWAAMNRFWSRAGCRYGDKRASFTGNKIVPPGQDEGPYGRIDYANNRLLLSSYHLGEDTVDEYLEFIRRFDPDFIDGYPSSIRYCAHRALKTNADIRISACFPTAETLWEEDREIIEEGFSTRVYDQYGSTESAALVTECPCQNLHVNPEIGIVEVVDEEGVPVSKGEIGELVLTGLNNHAMPLIRYRIGDLARGPPTYKECSCGWETPVIEEIIGRQDEVVITADGRRIPMLSYNVFKYTENIEESQIIQESVDEFVLRIVPDEGYTADQAETAVQKLKARVGEDITVKVETLEEIPRTNSGKFRAVVSNVNNR